MNYIITFLEGITTFISPCLLPMLPIYISFFAVGHDSEANPKRALINAFGFILGFTLVFVALGALAGQLGSILIRHQTIVDIVCGSVVILFGLNYLGVVKIPLLNSTITGGQVTVTGFFSAMLFGIVFSIGWTPCVGPFLGSALMMASQSASAAEGILMLLFYSLGLGIPFLLCAALIERLKGALSFIKRHYKIVNTVSGIFLILIGIFMISGMMGRFLALLTA